MPTSVCVFCSSSTLIDDAHIDEARLLGKLLAENGMPLIYGGANIGSMGALAEAVYQNGGSVVGIIPQYLADKGMDFLDADELLVTPGMHERKKTMEDRADAFIVLPGGFGTLEELLEVIVLKILHYHEKPIIIVNSDGFYDPLISLFQRLVEERFAKADCLDLYTLVPDVDAAMEQLGDR